MLWWNWGSPGCIVWWWYKVLLRESDAIVSENSQCAWTPDSTCDSCVRPLSIRKIRKSPVRYSTNLHSCRNGPQLPCGLNQPAELSNLTVWTVWCWVTQRMAMSTLGIWVSLPSPWQFQLDRHPGIGSRLQYVSYQCCYCWLCPDNLLVEGHECK